MWFDLYGADKIVFFMNHLSSITIIRKKIWRQHCSSKNLLHLPFRIPEYVMFEWSFIVNWPFLRNFHHSKTYFTSIFSKVDVIWPSEFQNKSYLDKVSSSTYHFWDIFSIWKYMWRQLCTFQKWRHLVSRISEYVTLRLSFSVNWPFLRYYHHLKIYVTSTLHFSKMTSSGLQNPEGRQE